MGRWAAISRRELLQRAGIAAGASAGAVVVPAGALRAEPAPFDPMGMPTTQPGELPSGGLVAAAAPAVNPAWTYLTMSYEAFQVVGTGGTLSLDTNGLHAATNTSLRAPLQLPHGATVREVTFWVYNGSPSTGVSVGVSVVAPPSADSGGASAFTQPNQGKHTVTLTSFTFVNPIDTTSRGYALSAFLTAGGLHGLLAGRVAYTPPPAPPAPPLPGLLLVPLAVQARKLDTRDPGPLTGKFDTDQTKVLGLTPELPPGAKAAVVNLTITETEGSGFLALFPGGTAYPGTSSINWSASGLTLANSAVVTVPASGALAILAGGGGRTHVLVDLVGYYV